MTFNKYYKKKTREKFIAAALNGSGIGTWNIVERYNLASDYPSDFDVVTVRMFFFSDLLLRNISREHASSPVF